MFGTVETLGNRFFYPNQQVWFYREISIIHTEKKKMGARGTPPLTPEYDFMPLLKLSRKRTYSPRTDPENSSLYCYEDLASMESEDEVENAVERLVSLHREPFSEFYSKLGMPKYFLQEVALTDLYGDDWLVRADSVHQTMYMAGPLKKSK